MPVYLIPDVKVTDDAWIQNYAANVHDIVHKHGGKYLSRSGNITTIEGEAIDTTLIALLEFPSMEAVQAFVDDPAYAEYGQARRDGSISRFHVIDDTDVAGTIPYLPAGWLSWSCSGVQGQVGGLPPYPYQNQGVDDAAT
jgi:uncharacterized protein (DUF1330 family)